MANWSSDFEEGDGSRKRRNLEAKAGAPCKTGPAYAMPVDSGLRAADEMRRPCLRRGGGVKQQTAAGAFLPLFFVFARKKGRNFHGFTKMDG
jgi:hypothetical protein